MNTVLRRRILSLPRSCARLYTTNNNDVVESPAPHRVTPQRSPPRAPTQRQTRWIESLRGRLRRREAHEGTIALNVPFSPPGGPGGNTPGGGGAFTFTKSPLLDAMLTAAIGLGAGKSIAQHTELVLLSIFLLSFHWRRRLRQMVQDKRLE